MPEEQNNQEEQNNNQEQEQQVTQSPITSEDPVVTQSDLKRFYEAIKPYLNTVSIPNLDISENEEPVNAVIALLNNGNEVAQEPALNFKDFDISDDSENERTDIKPHRLSSAELDDIVTRPLAVYRSNEYSESEQVVGHWIDGNVIYEKTISCGALPNAAIKQVPHGVADIDVVINMCGFASKTQESTELVDSIQLYYYCTDTNIVIKTYTDMTSWTDSYVTIRYTKVIGG